MVALLNQNSLLCFIFLNSLSDDKILDLSKFKALADDNFNVAQMVQFLSDMVQNMVGKGEIADFQYFSFPTMFSKGFFFRVVKTRDCLGKS